jgi:hypothetical protein
VSVLRFADFPRSEPEKKSDPMAIRQGDITRILAERRGAERDEALNRLVPVVYAELRAIAQAHLRRVRPTTRS